MFGNYKEVLFGVFIEFHSNGKIIRGTNFGFIYLMPKKSSAAKISNFRPISLVTSLYKLIAKVLSNRIRQVLHEVIDGNQFGFIKDKNILDSILIVNEVLRIAGGRRKKVGL